MNEMDLMSVMKWKELAEIEEYLGTPMDEWTELTSKAKLSFAMQYMMIKRNNPSFTIEEAEKLSIKEMTDLSQMDVVLPKEDTSA